MSESELHRVVERFLEPLQTLLEQDDVVEISLNGPHNLWVQYARPEGPVYERAKASLQKGLSKSWAQSLCTALANTSQRTYSAKHPMLGVTLPGGHRLQALIGENVGTGLALSIRVKHRRKLALSSFGLSEALASALSADVAAGQNVLISGGTNSGKTTFLNALLQHLPAHRRVITVEDLRELDVPCPNHVALLVSRSGGTTDLGYGEVIDGITRLNPDVVICGELSTHNVRGATRLIQTGHASFFATLHASSCLGALEAWRTNWELAAGGGDGRATVRVLGMNIHWIVQLQLDERSGRRQVVEIARCGANGLDLPWRQLAGWHVDEPQR